MPYYGADSYRGDRYDYDEVRPRTRGRGGDAGDYASHKPVTTKVGAGRRARVTVETGGDDSKYQEQHELEEEFKRLERATRLEESKRRRGGRERYGGPLSPTYGGYRKTDAYSRHNSLPIRTSYASPVGRFRRPGTDVPSRRSSVVEELPILESSEGENDDFDFSLPKPAVGLKFSESVAFEIPNKQDDDTHKDPASTGKTHFQGPLEELHISQSRWVGSSAERGELGGEIFTIPTTVEGSKDQDVPITKWYHMQRPMLNFEDFTAASLSVLQLPEKQQRGVSKLLRDVQKKFEKQRHHGRDMDPDCIRDFFLGNASDRPKQSASVMFLSFPYFSLDLYAYEPIRDLPPGSPLHPLRPILQEYFYATSKEREMEQVITRTPGTTKNECLHLSQIWFLMVNCETVITCSRLPLDHLRGSTIQQTPVASPGKRAELKISAANNRTWRIPVHRGMSWPAFLAVFEDLDAELEHRGVSYQFKDQEGVVDGSKWPEILSRALAGVPFELQITYLFLNAKAYDLQASEELSEPSADENTSAGDDIVVTDVEEIVVRAQSEPEPAPNLGIKPTRTLALETSNSLQLFKHSGSSSYMRGLADNFHTVLRTNPRSVEKNAYKKCPGAKSTDIDLWLTSHGQVSLDDSTTRDMISLRKLKRRLASIGKYLFNMFWPADFEHAITDKYWGAIYQVLNRENEFFANGARDLRNDLADASAMYYVLHDDILPVALSIVREFLTYEEDLRPLPDAFSKAWLHIITALVLTADTTSTKRTIFSHTSMSKHLNAVLEELLKAKHEISARLRKVELEDLEDCDFNSITAMLMSRLAHDNMGSRTRADVASAYGDYFYALDGQVRSDPVPRIHQKTIRYFLQEVEAIAATLADQMSVIEGLQSSLRPGTEDNDPIFDDALGESRQSLVIERCKAWIGGRIDKFKGLEERAKELAEWHRGEMESNKDRQENAILIFTIVTIIFLPLSFVASIMGMNTHDIRDMPYGQWVYWSAGVPLTIIVVFASLWFAGELSNLGEWIGGKLGRSQGEDRYRVRERPYTYMDEYPPVSRPGERSFRTRTRERERDVEDRLSRPVRRSTYPVKEY